MRYLHAIRVCTVAIAVCYLVAVLPTEWLPWLEQRFGGSAGIYDYGSSPFIWARERGVYIFAMSAVVIALFAVPRFRWGLPALAWCLFGMGACLLAFLDSSYALRAAGGFSWIRSAARQLCLALPPLMLGAFVRSRLANSRFDEPRANV